MDRRVTAELLDSLPADHPDAVASRRDLRRFNAYLGTRSWFSRNLFPLLKQTDRVMEIGAGDNGLSVELVRSARTSGREFSSWTTLDLQATAPVDSNEVPPLRGDLLTFDGYAEVDLLLGNMILHHFTREELQQLGRAIQTGPRLLLVQEPLRSLPHLVACRLFAFLMSRVTRHDAPVSIRAGFRGPELPELLCLDRLEWHVKLEHSKRGCYRMIAIRK